MDESTAWGELRSFVNANQRHPYKFEEILRQLGPQQQQGFQYALKHWGLSSDWTLKALRWAHAFELYLDAPLHMFPDGDYGHFSIERFFDTEMLMGYALGEDVGAPIINSSDGFFVLDEDEAPLNELVDVLSSVGYRSLLVDGELYLNCATMAHLVQQHGLDALGEYYLRSPTDGRLFDALMTMFDERDYIKDHSSPPDDEFVRLLAQIEDDEIRQPFQAFSTGDPDCLVCHCTPTFLQGVGAGLYPVLEIEDQCQQDYLTMVCYVGPGSP